MPMIPEIIVEVPVESVEFTEPPVETDHVHMGDVVVYDTFPSEEVVIESHDDGHEHEHEPVEVEEFSEASGQDDFDLPRYPGAPEEVQDSLEVDDEEVEIEEEQPKSIWDVERYPSLEVWLKERCSADNIPQHRAGQDPDDLFKVRRTISYLKKVLNKAADMVAGDFDKEIDVAVVGPMLNKIEESIERLEDLESELEDKKKKKRKKAEVSDGLVKEGQKATHVGGIIVTVPLLISRLARVCINGTVSGGHDIEDLFERQVKEYDLSKREQAELMQLLSDMNYPVRRDRGFSIDEKHDSSNGMDWNQNFPA